MQTVVRSEVVDVDAALARLGLTTAILSQAVKLGYIARHSCTANDAPNAPGFYQWNATLRGLREGLVIYGWARCDDGNFSTIVSPDEKFAISVASGNPDTGIASAVPCTRSSKGPNTVAAVNLNAAQLNLFPEMEAPPVHNGDDKRALWILLFFIDGRELRSELSLPISIDDDGRIMAWKERIILPAQPLEHEAAIPVLDFGPDVEINVQRRA